VVLCPGSPRHPDARNLSAGIHRVLFFRKSKAYCPGNIGRATGFRIAQYRPEVQFRVSGAPQGEDITTIKWASDDGANGQMRIELHGSNSMAATWWTATLGRQTAFELGYCRPRAAAGTLVAKFAVLSGRDPQKSPARAIVSGKALPFA